MNILIKNLEEGEVRTIVGAVATLQFGGSATDKGVIFAIVDGAQVLHQGYFPYGIDDPLSSSLAFLLMTAIVNAYPVEAVYTNGTAGVCTSVRVLSPA